MSTFIINHTKYIKSRKLNSTCFKFSHSVSKCHKAENYYEETNDANYKNSTHHKHPYTDTNSNQLPES